jgi:hypothetical protein
MEAGYPCETFVSTHQTTRFHGHKILVRIAENPPEIQTRYIRNKYPDIQSFTDALYSEVENLLLFLLCLRNITLISFHFFV